MKKFLRVFLVALTLVFGGIGFGGPMTSMAAETPTTFRWAMEPPDSMNPFNAVNASSIFMNRLTYESLVDWDQNFNYTPYLAKSWTTSPDGLTWTFNLTDKAKWQDGQALTSADVKFTIDYIQKNQLGQYSSYTDGITSVDAPNPTTVVIHLKKPLSVMLFNMRNLIIIPQHIWGSMTMKQAMAFANMPMVGSGPFKFITWKKGQYVEFDAVSDYWRGSPKIQKLILEQMTNAEAAVNELKAGQIDGMTSVPVALSKQLGQTQGITVTPEKSFWFNELILNDHFKGSKGNPLLHDRAVQLAIAHSIDKKAIVDQVLYGQAIPGVSIISPANQKWFDNNIQTYDFNLTEAKQILEQAGYTLGSDGIMQKNGKELKFRFNVMQDSAAFRAAQMISNWLKQVGISAVPVETQDLQSLVSDKFNYDLMIWDWSGYPDPSFNLMTLTTDQIGNWQDAGYSNTTYDKLYTQQMYTTDEQQRKQLTDQMQSIVYQDLPYIVLYYPNRIEAYNSAKWAGLVPMVDGYFSALNTQSAVSVHPVVQQTSTAATTKSSSHTSLWVGLIVVLVLAGGIILVVRRRNQDAD